jgi:hypothetical protein
MAKRSATATAELKVRLREPLRAKVERAAKKHRVSMNAEIVTRLENSFIEVDRFGGPDLMRVTFLMAEAFAHAGELCSEPNTPPAEWVRDHKIYMQAAFSVLQALLANLPDATQDEIFTEWDRVGRRLLSDYLTQRLRARESEQGSGI